MREKLKALVCTYVCTSLLKSLACFRESIIIGTWGKCIQGGTEKKRKKERRDEGMYICTSCTYVCT
jgi:hypothetical protein